METSLKAPNPWVGSPVYVRERTHSTMDDARALALGGCAEGTVVVAGFQKKGRGRIPGRAWFSAPWESLMATVVIDASSLRFPLAQLPLRTAVAVCCSLEEAGLAPGIKWPNDLTVEGKKLAGILCETCNQSALVGIGINCMQRTFPDNLATTACSILQATGREVSPLSLLSVVLARLKDALGDETWRSKLIERLSFRGERVRVTFAPDQAIMGTLHDVDSEGRLILRDDTGVFHTLSTGELRREP